MSLSAIAILLLSSLFHAAWNLFLKKSVSKQAFMWWVLLWSGILCSPVLLIQGITISEVGWICLTASIVAESLYYVTLTWGYEVGDLSIVYPLARGSAPLFIVCWAFLFLGERPTPLGWTGIGLVIAGVYMINVTAAPALRNPLRMFRGPAVRLALVTGLFISVYSVIDKVGVQQAGNPFVYFDLLFSGVAVLMAPYMIRTTGFAAVRDEWRLNKWIILPSAVCAAGSYALILYLLTFTKVSYVGAARSISVVFGVLLGWLHLKEGFGVMRTAAALLIFAGMTCLAMAE